MVYSDPAVTDIACAGLNGLKMGDRTLTVRRASEVSTVSGYRGKGVWPNGVFQKDVRVGC